MSSKSNSETGETPTVSEPDARPGTSTTVVGRLGIEPEPRPGTSTDIVEGPVPSWAIEIEALLTRAAELSVEHDVDPGAFMRGAWAAYVESRPGLRAHLEEMELKQQLEELRNHGQIGEA